MKTEFEQKTLDLRRVTRVVKGGKRFSFRAAVVVGDKNSRVGVGLSSGLNVASAVDKASRVAKKNLITIPIKKQTIPHLVEAKYGAALVRLKPAKVGSGIIAGGAVRVVCELSGIKNITAKILSRTKNKLTNAQATIEALKKIVS